MTNLEKLRAAQTLRDVARIIGVKPSTVSFLLYKLPPVEKYHSFEISKRNGGTRLINAPERRLKMLQRRLANVLYQCIAEIENSASSYRPLAHGFARSCSIFTNASVHRRRRYVLNLDLQDFFPSLNFGRVRGFFIKDKHFELDEKVATVIAQIACHNNELPQGSPCSPVISNLLGRFLDVRLVRFAKKNKCTYSRYADDITFSTNRKNFPTALAIPNPEKTPHWQLGAPLIKEINRAGFEINTNKTRLQFRGSRQVATGLIVNEKVNIRSEYYRTARAMCHSLFSTGSYYISDPEIPVEALNKIEGILNHINYIKDLSDPRKEQKKKNVPIAARKLYKKFLFYKHFVALEKPLIVPEGETDVIYLRSAMMKLTGYQPRLGKFVDDKFSSAVRFMKYSLTIRTVLRLSSGTGNFSGLIKDYEANLKLFKFKPISHPVIILIDNDDGAKDIFKDVKNINGKSISYETTCPFYHLHENLYLVKTPEIGKNSKSYIEQLFDQELRETLIDGKKFDPSNDLDTNTKYGKVIFAKKVVRPNVDQIDFSKFRGLLDRIVAVLDDYEKRKPQPM